MKASFSNFDSKNQPLVLSLKSEKTRILTQGFDNFVNSGNLFCFE